MSWPLRIFFTAQRSHLTKKVPRFYPLLTASQFISARAFTLWSALDNKLQLTYFVSGRRKRERISSRKQFRNSCDKTMASAITTTAVLGQSQFTSPKKMKLDNQDVMDIDAGKENQKQVLHFVKMTEKAHTPTKGSKLAAGYDLKSAYSCVVPARGSCLVKTDIQIQLPSGTYGRVAPRSGLALKNRIDVGAGVIDEDYRGNVGVILFNHGDEDFQIGEGDRIAQLICEKIAYPDIVEVKSLDESERGEAGFGSTGTKS